MNTRYDTGNVIRSKSSFADFRFPNQLPTEEWAGDEARSYFNYIRPIANLFENDRENNSFIKDFITASVDMTTSVINGCNVVKTTVSSVDYYEVKKGSFIYGTNIYSLFPACEAGAKQIEAAFQKSSFGDLLLKIWYDAINDKYYYEYTINGTEHYKETNQIGTAVDTISQIINKIKSITAYSSFSFDIEDSIILPIFKNPSNNSYFCFNGNIITSSNKTGTVFGKLTSQGITDDDVLSAKLNGAKINNGAISNNSLINNTVTIGSTAVALGATETNFTGVNSINGIQQRINNSSNIEFYNSNTHLQVPNSVNYTLGNACTKTYTDTISSSYASYLPTASAVTAYINNQIIASGANFSEKKTFNAGLDSAGKIYISNTGDAATSSDANASIRTEGGIAALGSIYSNGDVVARNAGTYSKRELKENISKFTYSAVDLINDVEIVNYTYKSDTEHNHKVGFIADDTNELFATKNHDMMDQSNCIGILLKAVQELSQEIKTLKEKVDGIRV